MDAVDLPDRVGDVTWSPNGRRLYLLGGDPGSGGPVLNVVSR